VHPTKVYVGASEARSILPPFGIPPPSHGLAICVLVCREAKMLTRYERVVSFVGGIFYQKYSRHFRPSGSLHGRSTGKSDMTLRAWSRWLTILRLPACVSTFEAYVESLRSREGLVRTVMTGVFSISFRFSLWWATVSRKFFSWKTNGLRVFRPAGVRKWNAWLVS